VNRAENLRRAASILRRIEHDVPRFEGVELRDIYHDVMAIAREEHIRELSAQITLQHASDNVVSLHDYSKRVGA
jgi:hypothetical protein